MKKTWLALACLVLQFFGWQVARAEPIRILVAVSHTRGGEGELPLRHSSEDANHVRDVMTSIGGVSDSAAIRLVDPSKAQLDGAIDNARRIAAAHAAADVTFFFYFSGHGDKEKIHLGDEAIALTDLVERVRRVPAALRILVTDACRNDPTRTKGFITEPAFALAGQGTEADGVVWLSASGSGEAAQESDELHGALFTHFWVSGLRGAADANGDGRVTLAESYDYAYSQTLLRSARGSGVLQHPSATLDIHQASPIVLTRTFADTTRLEFPQASDTRFLVYATGSRSIMGELWSSPDRHVALALPPGRYVVHRRGGGASAAVEVTLSRGQKRELVMSEFREVAEEQIASKGGEIVLRPNELSIEAGFGVSSIADAEGTAHLGYAYLFDAWALGFGPRAGYGVQHTPASNVTISQVCFEATLERRFRLGGPVLSLGAGAATDFTWQRVERSDAARVAIAGYPTVATFTAFAAGPLVVARLRLPLGTRMWMEGALRGELLATNFGASLGPLWVTTASAGMGFSF